MYFLQDFKEGSIRIFIYLNECCLVCRWDFRPVYEYLSIFGFISVIIFSGANVFFDYVAIPESIQPIFGIGWIAMDWIRLWKLCCLG